MKGMNEQSSIRIEDLTLYSYCISLKRELNAKMKFRYNSYTRPCASIGKRIGTPMPWERISAISETGGRIEVEAMKENDANAEDLGFKCPCQR